MEQIIDGLAVYFGLNYMPTTFMELVVWFTRFAFGCALFRYVLYSIFWLSSQFNKGGK